MLKYRRNKNKIKTLSKQQRFDLFKVHLKSTFRDTGIIPSDSDWKYEKPDKTKSEEIFIYGVNSSGAAIVIRYLSLPQEDRKCLKTATLIYKDGEDVYDYEVVDLVKSEEEQSYKLGALDIQVISPFRLFRIVFRGILRKRGINGSDEHLFVNIRLFWYPLSKVIDFKRDNKASFIAKDIGDQDINIDDLFEDRYEQYGELKGTIELDKNAIKKIFLWGSKCKKFYDNKPHNNRTWKRMFAYSNNGLTFHFGFSIDNVNNISFRYGNFCHGIVISHPLIKSSLSLNESNSFNDTDVLKLTFLGPRTLDITLSDGESLSDTLLYKKANINGGDGACIILEENSFINIQKLKDKVRRNIFLPESDDELNELTVDIYNNNLQSICGGKGASLSQLWYLSEENQTDAEIPNFLVPRGLIVTTNAYSQFLSENPSILEAVTNLQSIVWQGKHDTLNLECDRIVALVSDGKLPDSVKSEIRNRLVNIFDDENFGEKIKFAVRSSACGEDSEEMSAAGQMSSFLGVKGLENIYASVLKCWTSQFTHIAVQYKHGYGQLINTPMAVVIQEMVDCDVSGVLFTCNPLNGDPRKVTITANYGLCESVVSGSVEPDTITILVDPLIEKVEKVESVIVGSKTIAVKMSESEDGGTVETTLSSIDGAKCCIENEKAIEITKVALFLRRCFGNERDIEWGIKNNVIYLLQSRPVTTLDAFSEWEIMHEMDRANIVERGFISKGHVGEVIPGSMSFLGYGIIFAQSAIPGIIRLIRWGIDGEKFYSPYVYPGVVAICNQCFLDVNSWKLIMPMKKDTAFAKSFQYTFFGHEVDDCFEFFEPPDKRIIPPVSIGVKIKAGYHFTSELINSSSRLKKQYREYENFSLLSDLKTFKTSKELFEHISNSFHLCFEPCLRHGECTGKTQSSYVSVFSLLSKNKDNPHLFNDIAVLFSNNPDVVSVEIPKLMQKVAECIEDRVAFCEMSDEEALKFLLNGESEASKKFIEFLMQHGHRGYKEFDVMWLQLEDNPLPAVQSLKNMMKNGHKFVEKKVLTPDQIIASLKTDLSTTRKFLLKKMSLPWCQQGVGLREKSKSLLVRVINHFRKAFWLLAEMMKTEGLIPEKDLLFYLKIEEVDTLIRNRNPTLVARAKQRKKLFSKMDKFQFGEFVEGPDYTPRNAVDNSIAEEELMSCERVNGLPICVGVVEGRAVVCKDFSNVNDIQAGDILIAYGTDVGWSPYFPLLSGLVTEIGGLISHGAVIAREYGLPCIIGAKNVTRIFETGDRVVLDAENGVLYRKPK